MYICHKDRVYAFLWFVKVACRKIVSLVTQIVWGLLGLANTHNHVVKIVYVWYKSGCCAPR